MDNNTQKINLTLDPTGIDAGSAAAAQAPGTAADAPHTEAPAGFDESVLSEAEQQMIRDFSEKIDIADSAVTLTYGAAAQKRISDFSDTALGDVRNKDFGETGEMITDLIAELKGINDEADNNGFLGLFKNSKRKLDSLKTRYSKCETSVNEIVGILEQHQIILLKDVTHFDELYAKNLEYFKELTMYILAGKKALQKARETTLVELKEKAQKSGLPEDAQAANDYSEKCVRFERRLHDLELTRMVSIQMAPQIRMIQNNDTMMVEKIQTVIMNTIPLWKGQMVIALGIAHSKQAMDAQRAVTDMTNELLRRNADALHQATVDIAREAERGVVDIETLTETNAKLIQTLDEVQTIQAEGKQKRTDAEKELHRIEAELKAKLINMGK